MTWRKENEPRCFLLLLILMISLSACQEVEPTRILPSPTPRQEQASRTPFPDPTRTTSPTATMFPTINPSPSATTTPTVTPLPPSLGLTPIPRALSPVNINNLEQVDLLAIWGNGAPNDIVLSGDNSIMAVGTDLGTYLYDSFDFRFITLLRSIQPVRTIAFSPDNQLISIVEESYRLVIYEQSQFEQVEEIKLSRNDLPRDAQTTLFFSPESNHLTMLVESVDDIEVFRWNTENWEAAEPFSVETGLATFINESIGVLGIITEENLVLHSMTLPGDFRTLPLPPNPNEVEQAIQSHTRLPVISASSGDFLLLNQGLTVAYWDILDNEIPYHLEDYPQQEIKPCDQIPETCRNASGGFSFQCPEDSAAPPVQLLTLTPDDLRMLVSLDSHQTELRSALSGEPVWEIDVGYTKALFSLNDRFLLGLRADGVIEKRDLLDGELLLTLKQHPTQFFHLDFSPDGNLLAAGFNDDWIRVFSAQTGEMLGVLEGSANSLKFSPNGEQLAAGLTNGQVRIFELARGRFFDIGSGHLGPVTGLTFSQDGTRVTTASHDCTINYWNITDRYRSSFLIPGGENPIQLLDLEKSAASELLYAASATSVFQIAGETTLPIFSPSQGDIITDIALTADSQFLAIGGVPLWLYETENAEAPNNPAQVDTSSSDPYQVVFLPDANALLAVNAQAASFYTFGENQTPSLVHQLQLPSSLGRPVELRFSPSGDLIAIGSENGLIHVFGIPELSN